MTKNYYCKIKDKTYGPMTLEQLKNLAIQGKLKPSDKVSLTFPIKDGLEAGSIFDINEICKTPVDNSNSEAFISEETQYADFSFVDVDEYKKRFVKRMPNNEGSQGRFSQGVNLDLLEQNSIEIYKLLKNSNELLKNIYGWMNFYFYAGMVVAFVTILAALVNNKGR